MFRVHAADVITGPSAGSLGASVALSLAQGSPRQIILLGRNPAVITPLISEIKAVCPSTDVVFIQLDLGDLQSVRDAVPQIKAALSSLSSDSSHASVGIDCLINCAGVLAPKNYSLSKDGIELQFAVNHLGHFLLTNLLIDDVKRVGGIVINVSSGGHFLFDSDYDNYNMDVSLKIPPFAPRCWECFLCHSVPRILVIIQNSCHNTRD